jgi:lambda family phage minor tail protein L
MSDYNRDIQALEPGNLIRLYELDATRLGGSVWRFHGHAGDSLGMPDGTIVWQGQVYGRIQIQASGFDIRGDGRAASPTLQLANELDGVRGAISALCLQFKDLAGAKLRVIETFRHFLDAVNFADGNPSASDQCRINTWYIEQKTEEDRAQVTFELSSPIDLGGQQLPAQQITKLCRWACRGHYRGEACAYTGSAMFTKKDEPTDNPALDRCRGSWGSCRRRGNTRRFGGSLGASLIVTSR